MASGVTIGALARLSSTIEDIVAVRGGIRIDDDIYAGNPSSPDNIEAVRAAIVTATITGGEIIFGAGDYIVGGTIELPTGVKLRGLGVYATSIKLKDAANVPLIQTVNFDSLTGQNESENIPYDFGLINIRIDGNKANQTSTANGVNYYGRLFKMDRVMIHDANGVGWYCEQGITDATISNWRNLVESEIGWIHVNNCASYGIQWRGSHNAQFTDAVTVANNGDWGFISETSATYDGGIELINHIHSYANADDKGMKFGSIVHINSALTDGDNIEFAAAFSKANKVRCYNAGGDRDGFVINANACIIGFLDMLMWDQGTGQRALYINGDQNRIGQVFILGNSVANDGIEFSVSSAENTIDSVEVANFNQAGTKGIILAGDYNTVKGMTTNCANAFDYTAGSFNTVELKIFSAAGQIATSGDSATGSDHFIINEGGDSTTKTAHIPGLIVGSDVAPATLNYRAVVSTATLADTDDVLECTANTFTVNLHDATTAQQKLYRVVNTGAGTITLDGFGSQTVGGSLTDDISSGGARTLFPNGSNWIIT